MLRSALVKGLAATARAPVAIWVVADVVTAAGELVERAGWAINSAGHLVGDAAVEAIDKLEGREPFNPATRHTSTNDRRADAQATAHAPEVRHG